MLRCAHPTALIARLRADRRPYTRAEPGQHPHHIIGHLTAIQHHQPPTVRRHRRLHQLGVHPPNRSRCSPTTVATHGSASSRRTPAPRPLIPDPTSATTRTTAEPALAAALRYPRHPAIQIITLIMAGHPRTQTHTTSGNTAHLGDIGVHQHGALIQPHRRQRAVPKPAVRGLRMHTPRPRPLGQVHPTGLLSNTHFRSRSLSMSPTVANPAFGALFWGKMFSVVGVWPHGIVAAIVMYNATRSALMVGLVGVVQFSPQLILSPTSGKWADLGNPARQVLLGRVMCVAGSGSTAVWLAAAPGLEGGRAAIPVLVGSALVGIGFVVGGPAMQSIVPSLIRDGELSTAMALNSIPMTIGRMIGPAVGAYLAAHLGSATGFAVSTGLHFVFAIFLVLVRFPSPPGRRPDADYRVRTALKFVWRDRPLLLALIAVTTVGIASDPSITLTPSMAEELGGGPRLVGALSAAFGIGAGVGMAVLALLRGRLPSARVSSIGLWLLGAGCALLAIGTVPAVALAGFAVAGLGFGWAITGLSTVVQERAPDELRGRIMALWLVGFVGSRPIAAAVLGGTADLLSVQAAFVVAAALTVVAALLCLPTTLAGVAS
jgi:MFS family permease